MQTFAERLAALGLSVIRTESPHCYDAHGPTPRPLDASAPLPPRTIHPTFYGCFDWHSAVHSHWLLSELAQLQHRGGPWALRPELLQATQHALAHGLTPAQLRIEHEFLLAHPRFERPYGWAWFLRLCSSLRNAPTLQAEHAACASLEQLCATRLLTWLESLPYPIRSGEHGQSAFALSLLLDWAEGWEAPWSEGSHRRASSVAERHFAGDGPAALHLEPSGNDFLSPGLAAADVLTRTLTPDAFADFCRRYFADDQLLSPVDCPDPSDGKLAHLIGLNLSRAWMFLRIARHLPGSSLQRALLGAGHAHRQRGLEQCLCGDFSSSAQARPKDLAALLPFAVSHWIGSFVLLLEVEVRLHHAT